MKYLFAALLLSGCQPEVRVTGKIRTPPDIHEQKHLSAVTWWEGKVIAFADSFDAKNQHWARIPLYLDTQARELKRWPTTGHSPLGVSRNSLVSSYAFDSSGRVGIRMKSGHDSVVLLTAAPSGGYQGHQVEGPTLVIVSRDSIRYKTDSTAWRSIANGIEGDISALLLKDRALYLGSDNGEWGGVAARMDFGKSRPSIDTLFHGNVTDIESDSSGRIWFAGGMSHLGLVSCFLRTYYKGNQEVILDQRGVDFEDSIRIETKGRPKLRFDTLADIQGLQVYHGKVHILTNDGVYQVGEELTPLLEYPFRQCYHALSYRACSSPVGLLMGSEKSYVATRSLGLLELTQDKDGWKIRQTLIAR